MACVGVQVREGRQADERKGREDHQRYEGGFAFFAFHKWLIGTTEAVGSVPIHVVMESPSSDVQVSKSSGVSPTVWLPAVFLLAFPAGAVSALVGVMGARRGWARSNLVWLTVAFGALAAFAFLADPSAVTGYVDALRALLSVAGLSAEGLSPNWLLFVSSGLAVGWGLATWYAVRWRLAHKDDEDWLEEHPEGPDFFVWLFSLGRNRQLAARNAEVIELISEGDWFDDGVGLGYVLGSDDKGRKVEPVGIPDLVGGSVAHELILGSSGRGKTVSITRQAYDTIKRGYPVLVVDAKGDGDLAGKLAAYAEEFDKPFYHFSIPLNINEPYMGPAELGRAFYDPAGLDAGNHTRRRDFMMNARDWQGAPAVYSDKTRDWLSKALWVDNAVAIANGGRPMSHMPQATFTRVADLMSPMTTRDYLRDAIREFGESALDAAFGTLSAQEMLAQLTAYVEAKDQTGESARMSHAAWLRTFMSSVTGPYLRNTGDERTISIPAIVESGAVCVFDLATDTYREEAPALARLVVADLLSYISAAGKSDGLRLRVFLDEFAAVGGDESANVLARARSAGVSFTLSTQTLSDLRDVSEAFEGQVITNSLNILVHNASTWDEAQRLAGMTGQVMVERVVRSERESGERSKSRSTESRYRIEPDEFMEMGVGQLVKISQVERGEQKAVKVQVVMPPRVEPPVYVVEPVWGDLSKVEMDEGDSPVESPTAAAEHVVEEVIDAPEAADLTHSETDMEIPNRQMWGEAEGAAEPTPRTSSVPDDPDNSLDDRESPVVAFPTDEELAARRKAFAAKHQGTPLFEPELESVETQAEPSLSSPEAEPEISDSVVERPERPQRPNPQETASSAGDEGLRKLPFDSNGQRQGRQVRAIRRKNE